MELVDADAGVGGDFAVEGAGGDGFVKDRVGVVLGPGNRGDGEGCDQKEGGAGRDAEDEEGGDEGGGEPDPGDGGEIGAGDAAA